MQAVEEGGRGEELLGRGETPGRGESCEERVHGWRGLLQGRNFCLMEQWSSVMSLIALFFPSQKGFGVALTEQCAFTSVFPLPPEGERQLPMGISLGPSPLLFPSYYTLAQQYKYDLFLTCHCCAM